MIVNLEGILELVCNGGKSISEGTNPYDRDRKGSRWTVGEAWCSFMLLVHRGPLIDYFSRIRSPPLLQPGGLQWDLMDI